MTINWDEETKGTISYDTEHKDWFSNGWFHGWLDNKSTPSYVEETKGTISWTES